MITPLPLGEGKGEGPLLALNAVCSVLLCKSVRNRTHPLDEITHKQLAAEFFSHRTHRFNRTHLRTVSIPQNASGIQISQNVTAKGGCWVMSVRC